MRGDPPPPQPPPPPPGPFFFPNRITVPQQLGSSRHHFHGGPFLKAHGPLPTAVREASAPLPHGSRTVPQGPAITQPSPSVSAWFRSDGLTRLHAQLLAQPELMRQHEAELLARTGITVSSDVDFGIHNLDILALSQQPAGDAVNSGRAQDRAHAPPDSPPLQSCWTQEVTVSNTGSSPVLLISISSQPDRSHCLSLLDNHCLAANQQQLADEAGRAVQLLPGQSYSVSVVLSLDPHAIRSLRQDIGILGQFLLFTFQASPETQPSRGPADGPHDRILVMTRKVAVVLLDRRPEILGFVLKAKAVPFIPQALLNLFDTPPLALLEDSGISSLWGRLQMAPTGCQNSIPAIWQRGLEQSRSSYVWDVAVGTTGVHQASTIRPFIHMLAAEEAAMQREALRSSLYNMRIRCAGITSDRDVGRKLPSPDAAGSNYTVLTEPGEHYSVVDWPGDDGPAPKQGGKTKERSKPGQNTYLPYRGPKLLGQGDNIKLGRYLAMLEVPGLLEGRPSLLCGDMVYVRLGIDCGHEYIGRVLTIDQGKLFLLMPIEWWIKLDLVKLHISSTNKKSHQSAAEKTWPSLGSSSASSAVATGPPPPLCHIRFTFDRTSLHRMSAALLRSLSGPQLSSCQSLHSGSSVAYDTNLQSSIQRAHGAYSRRLPTSICNSDDDHGMFTSRFIQQRERIAIKGKTQLNLEQRSAVAAMMCGAGRSGQPPFVLFGPPGTGKTVTLVECALQLLSTKLNADGYFSDSPSPDGTSPRLLLCAPQNYSADLICSALAEAGLTPKVMTRLQDPRRRPAETKEDVLPFSVLDPFTNTFKLPIPAHLATMKVVVCTCFSAGILAEDVFCSQPLLQAFDVVIIDEAGQATIPESLIPVTLTNKFNGLVMLCGDPRQLSPVVRSMKAKAMGLGTSLIESLTKQQQLHSSGGFGSFQEMVMLTRNYRSHQRLLELPSRLFYGDALLPCADDRTVQPPEWSELNSSSDEASSSIQQEEDQPNMLFYGVRGQQIQDGDAPSFYNPIEAGLLVDLLFGLVYPNVTDGVLYKRRISPHEIGVICTYRKQVFKLRHLLREKGLGAVKVGTVDDYQGQEARVVFISTVLSSCESLPQVALARPADRQDYLDWFKTESSFDKLSSVIAEGGSTSWGAGPWTPASAAGVTQRVRASSVAEDIGVGGFWSNPKRFNVAITRSRALLVVVGHPLVLVQDRYWKELLRHCAARGLYRGAGLQLMEHALNYGDGQLDIPDELGDDALKMVVTQIAELALLGVGDSSLMFPTTLDEYEDAMAEEVPSRIAL